MPISFIFSWLLNNIVGNESVSCKTPRVVRHWNIDMGPAGLGNKNKCAGEGQLQFFRPTNRDYTARNDRMNNELWIGEEMGGSGRSLIDVTINISQNIGFEAVSAVHMNSTVLWIVTPYSSERARHFGGTYHLHLQGRSESQARNQQNLSWAWHVLLLASCLASLEMEEICCSETSDCPRNTRRYNPDDCTLHQSKEQVPRPRFEPRTSWLTV
jgi:hypothetical protein